MSEIISEAKVRLFSYWKNGKAYESSDGSSIADDTVLICADHDRLLTQREGLIEQGRQEVSDGFETLLANEKQMAFTAGADAKLTAMQQPLACGHPGWALVACTCGADRTGPSAEAHSESCKEGCLICTARRDAEVKAFDDGVRAAIVVAARRVSVTAYYNADDKPCTAEALPNRIAKHLNELTPESVRAVTPSAPRPIQPAPQKEEA